VTELDRVAIAGRLAVSRDQAGITQRHMAELMHVHENTVGNWESAKKTALKFDRLDEWARLTGVTKEWLLHGDLAPAGMGALVDELRDMRPMMAELQRLLERARGSTEAGDETPTDDDHEPDLAMSAAERAEYYSGLALSKATLEGAWWKYDSIDGAAPGAEKLLLVALTAIEALEEVERAYHDHDGEAIEDGETD
jgi:transcriptional regulator with XRE-family HTH domain